MDNPEPRAQYLNIVLRQIGRTALRIPRFQRHFVWGERDVIELLSSIQKGYPIGSILTWRVEASDDYFSGFREDPFPTADETIPAFEVVLDGAQRLSTLYGCLRNAASNPIYQVVFDLRLQTFQHLIENTNSASQIPMDALFDSRRFLAVQSEISELEDADDLLPSALELYSTFQDYQIPIIAISNAVLEDVVEVFRRVNSSGTPLSSVDFVRALTWQSSFDLEETFDQFVEQYQGTALEGLGEEFLVRCLSIAAGLSLDSRDVGQLKALSNRPEGLAREIDGMRVALDAVAGFLQRLSVRGIREVPYDVQRLLLFSIKLYGAPLSDDEIEEWFWRSTFAEEHQSKPESYVTRLIREIRGGNPLAALEVRKPVDRNLLATRTRRAGSAVAIGFELLLRNSGAKSLLSGNSLSDVSVLHGLLFTREQMTSSSTGLSSATSLSSRLANLVLLTEEDAREWHSMRGELTLKDLFDICDERTSQASEIWLSQGLELPFDEAPEALLERRSAVLLSKRIPELPTAEVDPALPA